MGPTHHAVVVARFTLSSTLEHTMFILPLAHRSAGLPRRFDRFFDEAFERCATPPVDAGTPAVDVIETDTAYTVKLDMPGVAKDDIQISVEGRRVTIQAPIKRDDDKTLSYVHRERDVKQWSRSLRLPLEVDQTESAAKLELGVLTLTLAKRSASAASRITVN